MRQRPLCGILLLALFVLPSFAGTNRWTITGPDGGAVSRLAFDPANPSIVFAASDNGVFRSVDGGQHWVAAAELLGTAIPDLAVAPTDPQKVFASSAFGLYKSIDRGATWAVVHPFASYKVAVSRSNPDIVYSYTNGGPMRSSDGGVTFGSIGVGLPSGMSPSALAIDPQNPDVAFAAFLPTGGVYKSVDGGAHWTPANNGLVTSVFYYSLVTDPANGATLYLGGGGALYKSTDGGSSWAPLSIGLAGPTCYSLAISSSSPSTLVVGTNLGSYRTTNGGSTWQASQGISGAVSAIAIDPINPANVVAVASFRPLRSTDRGANFTASGSGLAAQFTQGIAVDPRNESTLYSAGPAGIFKSTDRGETWSSTSNLATGSVAVDPFTSSTLYAISSGGFRRSLDGGTVWQSFNEGLPPGSASVIATDPQVQGTLYTIVASSIYKKAGALPWAIRNTGLPANGFPNFITVDPANSSTLYTGTASGLFKSTNGGDSWSPSSGGLGSAIPGGLAVDPFNSNHLFCWSSSAAYESTDGGTNWVLFPRANFPGTSGRTFIFDPALSGSVYANSVVGVQRSIDGGLTFSPIESGLGRFHGSIFVVAPGGGTLYAGGTTGGVWSLRYGRRRAAGH